MTHEIEAERTTSAYAAESVDAVRRAVGRQSTSAALLGPARPAPSGILMRKASGATAGDVDVESAVATASGGAGVALPDELRSRFEGSLGTDLSSVRVHTGAESEAAAAAVGAKAYALGNDIHFAAGQYDPSSASGQELIAHEVAHTVQQRGGAAQRQHKLVVSQSSDAFEHEADAAASAMVAGRPAQVSSSGILVARSPDASKPAAGGKDEKTEAEKWPTWKDTSAKLPLWPEMGTALSFDWGENPSLKLGMEGELERKLFEAKHSQGVQLGPGVTGSITGSVGVSVFAGASGSASGTWSEEADGKKQLTKTLQGGGEAGIKATGALQISVGAGVANVLALEGGIKGTLTAESKGSVSLAGTTVKKYDGTETGSTKFTAKAEATLSAGADLVVDLVVPGDRKNIYSYTLGKIELASATVEKVTGIENGQPINTPVTYAYKIAPELELEERAKRPMTEEEQRKVGASEADNGASGNRAESKGDLVDMSDQELFDAGVADARQRLTADLGKVAMVSDPDTAGLAIAMIVDGSTVRGSMSEDPARRQQELEHGKKLRKVTSGAIVRFDVSRATVEIVKSCAKTPSAVSRAVLAQHARIEIVGASFEYDDVPPTRCMK